MNVRFAAAAILLFGAAACQGMRPGPPGPVPAAECHIEIINQFAGPISVTASGRTVRNIGSIPAGGAVRYAEDCQAGTIRFLARIQELPPGVAAVGRSLAPEAEQFEGFTEVQSAKPRPGELTRVIFRSRRVRRF